MISLLATIVRVRHLRKTFALSNGSSHRDAPPWILLLSHGILIVCKYPIVEMSPLDQILVPSFDTIFLTSICRCALPVDRRWVKSIRPGGRRYSPVPCWTLHLPIYAFLVSWICEILSKNLWTRTSLQLLPLLRVLAIFQDRNHFRLLVLIPMFIALWWCKKLQ